MIILTLLVLLLTAGCFYFGWLWMESKKTITQMGDRAEKTHQSTRRA